MNRFKKTFFALLLMLMVFSLPLAGCVEVEDEPLDEPPIEQPETPME